MMNAKKFGAFAAMAAAVVCTHNAMALDLPGAGETYTVPSGVTNVITDAEIDAYNALGKVVFTDETSALRFTAGTAPNVQLEGSGWMIIDYADDNKLIITQQQTTAWIGTWDIRDGYVGLGHASANMYSGFFRQGGNTGLHDLYVREGAHVGFENGTLTLNFTTEGEVTDIVAGTPYIIRWTSGSDIINPVFEGVTISSANNDFISVDANVHFVGTYDYINFDAENKKGVGLFQNTGTLAFCVESAAAYNDADNVYTPDESDGSVNLASIKALDDYSESNYPAFYYVDHYSYYVSSDLGTYANDWYIPAKNELMSIYNNKTTLDAAMELAGGAKFTANWYWSSNRRSEELKDNAAVLMFNNGSWNNYNKKSNGGGGYWCFVRKF